MKTAKKVPAALAERSHALVQAKRSRLVAQGKNLIAVVDGKRRVIASAFYEMGKALLGLSDREQYKALGYTSFSELLSRELEMSASQAERLVLAAKNLDETQAMNLGYEKSLVVANALGVPGAKLIGTKLVLGARSLDTESTSAKEIQAAVTQAKHAGQRPGTSRRGNTTSPSERALARSYQALLRRKGAKGAIVLCKATKPGHPPDFIFRVSSTQVDLLGDALRRK